MATLDTDPALQVRPADEAGHGEAVLDGTAGPAGAVATPVMRRGVAGVGSKVPVGLADHALGFHGVLAPPDNDRTEVGQNVTDISGGLPISLSPDDVAKGWTIRMLAAAYGMYRRGDRSPITTEGNRRYELARRRSRRARAIYAKPLPVDLDEVTRMLRCGETLETAARRCGVQEDSILTAVRRKGTPDQRERILRASAEMREIRISLGVAS